MDIDRSAQLAVTAGRLRQAGWQQGLQPGEERRLQEVVSHGLQHADQKLQQPSCGSMYALHVARMSVSCTSLTCM